MQQPRGAPPPARRVAPATQQPRDAPSPARRVAPATQQPPILGNKRPRPAPSAGSAAARLNPNERRLYDAILATRDAGIFIRNVSRDLCLTPQAAGKLVKSLLAQGLIKEVKSIQYPVHKVYMASEFNPNAEMSGGSWYSNGALDTDLITHLRQVCLHYIQRQGVSTPDKVSSFISSSGAFRDDITPESIGEVLSVMALDGDVEECVSTGVGDFAYIIKGRTCYRIPKGRPMHGPEGDDKRAARGLTAVPCGTCPRIHECTPDGLISPKTCIYFDRWINSFDF